MGEGFRRWFCIRGSTISRQYLLLASRGRGTIPACWQLDWPSWNRSQGCGYGSRVGSQDLGYVKVAMRGVYDRAQNDVEGMYEVENFRALEIFDVVCLSS